MTTAARHPTAPAPSHAYDDRDDATMPLRDRAFALHCRGLRSGQISARLHVPARTIRAWIAADLDDTERERESTREQHRAIAVERLLSLANASWDAFETITARPPDPSAADQPAGPVAQPTWATGLSPARFLALALTAYREIARLQGLHANVVEPPAAKGDTPESERDLSRLILIPPPPPPAFVTPDQRSAWYAFLRIWEPDHPESVVHPDLDHLLPCEEAIALYDALPSPTTNLPTTPAPHASDATNPSTDTPLADHPPRNPAEMATAPQQNSPSPPQPPSTPRIPSAFSWEWDPVLQAPVKRRGPPTNPFTPSP